MKNLLQQLSVYALTAAMAMTGCAVVAESSQGQGQGMGRDKDRAERRDDRKDDRRGDRDDDRRGGSGQVQVGGYFGERQRSDVYAYYGQPPRAHCPPGLAKKNNGCQPPGQAKKWKLGQPLPRDIGYSPVEAEVRIRLGTPPAGYEFVRVAQDILMIAVGTSIVMDAIEDLRR